MKIGPIDDTYHVDGHDEAIIIAFRNFANMSANYITDKITNT